MSKRGPILRNIVAVAALGILSACHAQYHGGGTVYRPHDHSIPTGPVETHTTTVRPHHGDYRYVRYRRDRHGRYFRHPHGDYYLARDGRYYRHSDVRYRRDRYGRFHRDRHGEYYLARDGRYYSARDGHYSEPRRGLYNGGSRPAISQPRAPVNANRAAPPAHGLHGTEPGHLRTGATAPATIRHGGLMDKSAKRARYGGPERPPAPASEGKPAHERGYGKAPHRPGAVSTKPQRGNGRRATKRPEPATKHPPDSGKRQAKSGTGKGKTGHKGAKSTPDETTGKDGS